ncbi:MAG: TIGR03013 family XrtA/PEP-CTERM system glycosyltransferase [Blastocatellia bacterium]
MISSTRSRAIIILLFESLLTCLCGAVAIWLRFGAESQAILRSQHIWLKVGLLMLVVQGAFYLFDLYDFRRIRERATLYVRIFQAMGLAAIALAVTFYAVPQMMLGRGVFAVSLLLMLTLMSCWRVFVNWLLGHPRLAERVLILGTDGPAINLAREVLARPEVGYRIIGFVGDDPSLVGKSLINPCVIGLTSDLEEIVHHYWPDRIVVAISDRRGHMPVDPLLRLKFEDSLTVEEMASFHERLTGKISTDMLRPSWLIFSNGSRRLRLYRRARRLADVVLATVGLLLSLPLMLLTAIAIKLDSRGPVLYLQERVGLQNAIFKIIKFRSMRTDAEKDGAVWAIRDDPRVTRVGRVIRKLRIDELPQFINVIRGEMSFIGPRPERPMFVAQLEQANRYYSQRHLVKPGLTGWAQIKYSYGASVEEAIEKLQYDLYYIKNQSPVLDAIIIFETIRIVLFGRGAR